MIIVDHDRLDACFALLRLLQVWSGEMHGGLESRLCYTPGK